MPGFFVRALRMRASSDPLQIVTIHYNTGFILTRRLYPGKSRHEGDRSRLSVSFRLSPRSNGVDPIEDTGEHQRHCCCRNQGAEQKRTMFATGRTPSHPGKQIEAFLTAPTTTGFQEVHRVILFDSF